MDILDGWIYALDFYKHLYKIKADGPEYIELNDHIVDFCINGEWIYYLTPKLGEKYGGDQLWRMRTDGTQKQQLMQEDGFSIDYDEKLGLLYRYG